MALSYTIANKNYTSEVTPKTEVTTPIDLYLSAQTYNNYEEQTHTFEMRATLVSYEGTASPYYPFLRVDLGYDDETEGFALQMGCGEYEDVEVNIDGTTYTGVEAFTRLAESYLPTAVDMSLNILNTNLPIIFDHDNEVPTTPALHLEDWEQYTPSENPIIDVIIQQVSNFREIVPEDFTEYWTKVTKGNYTISQTGKELNGVNSYAWETIRVRSTDQGKLAWAVSSDGKTVTLVRTKTVLSDVWSDSRGSHWEDAITPHFTTLSYEWDGVTYGTFDISTSFKYGIDTNIPIFDNRDIQAYLDGDKDITDSKGYNGTNTTGTPENETDFPDVTMSMNSVSSLILMTSSGLATLNSNIFDVQTFGTDLHDLIETLSSGWQGFLSTAETALLVDSIAVMRPMEMFNSIFYYPFDVTNITTSQSITALNCGLRTIVAPTGSKVVTSCNGSINLGSVTVERTWFDYRDLTNMRCEIYLPYIGYATLNLNEIIGKSVNVKYFVDLYSGACVAVITANGRMIAYKQGMIGVNMAITPESTNGLISNVAGVVASAVTQNYVGVATSAVGAVNNFLSASASSCPVNSLGLHLPQYAFFVFESDNINETQNEVVLDGKPSDVSGSIGSFSGFLKVKSVNLTCSRATEKEKQKIKSLLYSGIYI